MTFDAAKLRALAEFAAGAGHEINNPVATIVGYVQQLLADETDPDRRFPRARRATGWNVEGLARLRSAIAGASRR